MERQLTQFVERCRKVYGDDLVSLVLYGSAADPSQHDKDFSDINVLCVLREITPLQLRAGEPLLLWLRRYDIPAPLFITAEEIPLATDCYAIEFRDMQIRRRVLYGPDVVAGLTILESFHRVQVEYELRSKLLRLRRKAAEVYSDRKLLSRLLLDSASTFCVLIRHVLLIHSTHAPPGRRETLEAASRELGLEIQPFLNLLDVREKRIKSSDLKPEQLLGDYLRQIERMILAVNALEKPAMKSARGDQ